MTAEMAEAGRRIAERFVAGLGSGVVRQRYDTVAELEALPDQAVIYDGNNQVWQHGIGGMSPGLVGTKLCTMSWNTQNLWVTFGSLRIAHTAEVALPAYLLDDGL